MSHLTLEVLARLVDEPPMPDEAIHLNECAACRCAVDGLRAQAGALRSLAPPAPPAGAWERIAERVRNDGRIAARRRRVVTHLMRLAAAVVLVASGAGVHAWIDSRQSGAGLVEGRESIPGASRLISGRRPLTLEDAVARIRAAELVYRRSLLDYSAMASPQPPRDLVARLATLDAIVLTTRTALERAPTDPVINTYHVAALAERESLLDQMR